MCGTSCSRQPAPSTEQPGVLSLEKRLLSIPSVTDPPPLRLLPLASSVLSSLLITETVREKDTWAWAYFSKGWRGFRKPKKLTASSGGTVLP